MWSKPWKGARVEASSRCSSTQTQQLLAEDSSRTVRRMTMVDDAVCDLGHAQGRGGDGAGCSKCRTQIRAMSARDRLEARSRIERMLDEDRRRVAPPPDKATTPVGWLDHERRCCSLEGTATTSYFRSVDDEWRRTAGRRKPILDQKRKTAAEDREYNLGCT